MPPKGWKKPETNGASEDNGNAPELEKTPVYEPPEGMVLMSREEHTALLQAKVDLEHAQAQLAQIKVAEPPSKPIERDFRCKRCHVKFRSTEKRPKCPQGCNYPWEARTAHNDFITTELVPDA